MSSSREETFLERVQSLGSGWRGPREQGRNACTTFLIVDAQSVKNSDTATLNGYDAGKKISGIKRHIAVGTQGLPHAVAVTTAEQTDRKGALEAFKRCKRHLSRVQSVLADGGYGSEPFAQGVREMLGENVTVQIAKRSELHTFEVRPKRWKSRAQRCMVGQEQAIVEKLRTMAQHQLAVHPSRFSRPFAQKTLNVLRSSAATCCP
jgi:transposase